MWMRENRRMEWSEAKQRGWGWKDAKEKLHKILHLGMEERAACTEIL